MNIKALGRYIVLFFFVFFVNSILIISLKAQSSAEVNKLLQKKKWTDIERAARGRSVYFNAWGGSQKVNEYLRWAKVQLRKKYDVNLLHIKLGDTVEAVTRISIEVSAAKNKEENGSVDLLWVNGENFSKLKREHLLFGPFTKVLPNMQLVDDQPILRTYDFSESIEGYEAPWGRAILTFFYNTNKISTPPKSMAELLQVSKKNKGKFAYPAPPNFHGTTFLKQVAYETFNDANVLLKPMDENMFKEYSAPLWAYLDKLHVNLWRNGTAFPTSLAKIHDMVDATEIFLSFSFNPFEVAQRKLDATFPASIKTYVHSIGTIGNAHFLAIPINSPNKMASLVVANFLLSPLAQGHKNSVAVWGDPHVLSFNKMNSQERREFTTASGNLPTITGLQLQEPHSSWVVALEKEWLRRYK